jgi:hypothetical protein
MQLRAFPFPRSSLIDVAAFVTSPAHNHIYTLAIHHGEFFYHLVSLSQCYSESPILILLAMEEKLPSLPAHKLGWSCMLYIHTSITNWSARHRRRAAGSQVAKPNSSRAAGAGGSSNTMLKLYTDDSPGLRV